MTCTQMLERLIEADPDVLAGRGSSDVALHVRECARCRAVADSLLAETRMLAAVVHGAAVVRRIRPAPVVLAIAAAAAAMAFMMLPDQPAAPAIVSASQAPVAAKAPPPIVVAPVVVSPTLREPPPQVASQTAPRSAATVAVSRPALAIAPPSTSQRHVASAYPPATPMTVSPMRVTPSETSYQQVAVTPPPGKRAAVMRTSDPAITVVWVY